MKMKPVKRIACAALLLSLCAAGTQALAAAYGDAILREGMRTQEVRRMQEDLAELGYYKGNVTGHYGGLTEEAVRRFQRKNGLTVDGIAGPATLGRLAELTGQAAWTPGWDANASGGGWTGGGSSDGTLRLDDRGDAVQRLQENLNLLGYYDGTVTGHYGRLTKEAVRLFQRDNELTSDGIAGPRTLEKIEALVAGEIKDDAAGKDAQQGDVKEETASNALDPSVTLRYGSRSQHVSKLQDALRALGFFNRDTTGYYGLNTAQAVEDYQDARGLNADGIAGRATLTMLNRELAGQTVADGKADEGAAGADAQQGDKQEDKKEETAGGELDTSVTLRYGNRSQHVSKLQDALRALGYFDRDTTGYYGLNTTWAVEAYQRAKGLSADGIAGRATLTAINKDLAAAAAATAAPVQTVSTLTSVSLGNSID